MNRAFAQLGIPSSRVALRRNKKHRESLRVEVGADGKSFSAHDFDIIKAKKPRFLAFYQRAWVIHIADDVKRDFGWNCFRAPHVLVILWAEDFVELVGLMVKKLITDFCFNRQFPRFDLLHVPHNFEALANPERALVTIHDAMFFSYPEDFLGHQFARENYPELAKACKGIVTCSNASKSDIVYFMGIHPDKITVIPWGINHQLFSPGKEEEINLFCAENRIKRPYFLMVSCDIGRKNTLTLMKAYHLFAKSNPEHMLILVWNNPPKSYRDQFSREIESDCIRFEGGINDETLHLLYTGASASFFPSRYEGFGLPVLESMACGTPVITCRNSALPEVGGNAPLYIDPDDVRGMADIMEAFEKNTIDRKDLSKKCLVQAAEFTWEKTARAYLNFYKMHLKN